MSIIGVLVYWNASGSMDAIGYNVYCSTAPGPPYTGVTGSPMAVGHVLHCYVPVPGAGRYYFNVTTQFAVGEGAFGTEFYLDVYEPAGRTTHMVRRQLA